MLWSRDPARRTSALTLSPSRALPSQVSPSSPIRHPADLSLLRSPHPHSNSFSSLLPCSSVSTHSPHDPRDSPGSQLLNTLSAVTTPCFCLQPRFCSELQTIHSAACWALLGSCVRKYNLSTSSHFPFFLNNHQHFSAWNTHYMSQPSLQLRTA